MPAPTTPLDLTALVRDHEESTARLVAALRAEADRLEARARAFREGAGLISGDLPLPDEPLRLGETIAPRYRSPEPPAEPRTYAPRGKRPSLEEVRDWVRENGREPFRTSQVIAALEAARAPVTRHLITLVEKGVLTEIGPRQARRYQYVPPPHGTGPKAFDLTANGSGDKAQREAALPVPGTGKPAGPSDLPSGRPSPARRGSGSRARTGRRG